MEPFPGTVSWNCFLEPFPGTVSWNRLQETFHGPGSWNRFLDPQRSRRPDVNIAPS